MGDWAIKLTTLSDAAFFLNQARTAEPHSEQRNRAIRVCVLLSWIACESLVSEQFHKVPDGERQGVKGLRARVEFLLARKGHPFSKEAFEKTREARNRMTHPEKATAGWSPPVEIAVETFEFCRGVMQKIYDHRLYY